MFWNKKRVINKKAVEWEIGKILIAVVILIILVFAVIILVKGGGEKILDTIKNLLRFGKA